jgi:hypothetical protein
MLVIQASINGHFIICTGHSGNAALGIERLAVLAQPLLSNALQVLSQGLVAVIHQTLQTDSKGARRLKLQCLSLTGTDAHSIREKSGRGTSNCLSKTLPSNPRGVSGMINKRRQAGLLSVDAAIGLIVLAVARNGGSALDGQYVQPAELPHRCGQAADVRGSILEVSKGQLRRRARERDGDRAGPGHRDHAAKHQLPAGRFSDTNAFGQTIIGLARRPNANQLEAIVVTVGGQTIPEIGIRTIAENLGARWLHHDAQSQRHPGYPRRVASSPEQLRDHPGSRTYRQRCS